jgi:hypothetical protein
MTLKVEYLGKFKPLDNELEVQRVLLGKSFQTKNLLLPIIQEYASVVVFKQSYSFVAVSRQNYASLAIFKQRIISTNIT